MGGFIIDATNDFAVTRRMKTTYGPDLSTANHFSYNGVDCYVGYNLVCYASSGDYWSSIYAGHLLPDPVQDACKMWIRSQFSALTVADFLSEMFND